MKLFAANLFDLLHSGSYERLFHCPHVKKDGNPSLVFLPTSLGWGFPSRQTIDEFRVKPSCSYGPIRPILEICSKIMEIAKLDNCWIIQADGVSLATGVQPNKQLGICHGLSGAIHAISECAEGGAIHQILHDKDFNADKAFSKFGICPLISHASGALSFICGIHCNSSEHQGLETLLKVSICPTRKMRVFLQLRSLTRTYSLCLSLSPEGHFENHTGAWFENTLDHS